MKTTAHMDWVQSALARYEQPLLRYAQRITGDVETARDVVQDTFMKLCTADRGRINAYLAPWLYRVCRNRALDIVKKERRMQPTNEAVLTALPSTAAPPGAAASGRETEALVLDCLAALPDNQQEVFRLKFQDQLSYKEISDVTGHPLNHVRYLIHISLKHMRERLRDRLELAREL